MIFDRTFHPDEANQAFTVGRLLETGQYVYRPEDHHGPTLYYAAAPIQKAFGHGTTAALDGTLLRCTPLFFAVLALVFGFLALRRLTRSWLIPALFAVLLGTSPIFVFFATDFIQEMLLACFTLMMLWAGVGYLLPGGRWKPGTWALLFGIAAGLAFATKETSVISFAAASLAAFPFLRRVTVRPRDAVLAFAGFLLTATILFTSFCANWHGLYDAFVAAPLSYLNRAAGSAASSGASWHVHPWRQYISWLFLPGWRFSALPLLALFLLTFRRSSFLHIYTISLFALYSVIPYKTPWCGLQIVVPMILASFSSRPRFLPAATALAVAALTLNLCGVASICHAPDSKAIPYNYASASPEVKELAATVAQAMRHAPDTSFVAVALPPEDTWPFPWYNRALETQTGYWTDFSALQKLSESGAKPTVVIVPMTEGHLVQPLFPYLKNTKRFYVRPGVRVRVFW